MARNEFETEIGKLLKETYPIAERLDDAAFNRDGQRQVRKKPWDYYGCTMDGLFWVAEVKRVKTPYFPMDNLKEHQHAGLTVAESLGKAWLFINWRTDRRGGQAVMLPYRVYLSQAHAVQGAGRKSLKADDFGPDWQLERVTGGWKIPDKAWLRD